jgi:hypothetical protein
VLAASGGTWFCRVEVWRNGVRVDSFGDAGLPLTSGSLSATLHSGITRTVSLEVPVSHPGYRGGSTMIPWLAGDLLDPLANELRVWAGWKAGGAVVGWWPVFRGFIQSTRVDGITSGSISVDADDLAEAVVADGFIAPRASTGGALVTTVLRDLVSDSVPSALFGSMDPIFTKAPVATWTDRSQALDDLASASNAHWYALADGSFTLRTIPWSQRAYGAPVATWMAGTGLLNASVEHSRSEIYNAVVVSSSTADASDPLSGTDIDSDPSSRTYLYGPLGGRVLRPGSEKVSTLAGAQALARDRRIRSLSTLETWATTMRCDPSLELGDVCEISAFGQTRRLALSGFGLPLTGEPEMSATWRPAGGAVDE